MIIVAAALIGVLAAALAGADLRRLVHLPVQRLWLVWVAIGVQVGVLSLLGPFLAGPVGNVIHLSTYGFVAVFVVMNRKIPGVTAMGIGGGMNLAAIIANGGVMPASATAWRIAGKGALSGFENSLPVDDAKLAWLGDVFALPAGWPLANVFSAGDVVLVVGLVWMVHRAGRPDPVFVPPAGYVLVPITDEHREVLVSTRARLDELMTSMQRQAADVGELRGDPFAGALFDDDTWGRLLTSLDLPS
jgi:hypothetical protein